MLKIGCHLSSANGFLSMAKTAASIGANTFQFFTRNPRGSKAKKIDEDDIAAFLKFSKKDIGPIIAHAPYTLNACSATERTVEFAKQTMADDLKRMEHIPGNFYNFHPGSHVGQGIQVGIEKVINMLNEIIKPEQNTTVLLETMSGKGSEVGKTFDEIKKIIDGINYKEKVGVCLDTCHVYDAGYDIVNNLDNVIDEFDSIIGLENLFAVHLNDSINPIGSHKDRHQKIGEGSLGLETIINIVNHPKLKKLPFILETPNDLEGYAKEIELIKKNSK